MKHIRQAVLAARDLTRVESELCQVLGIQVAYRDPAVGFFGLVNAVMPVGTQFVEVVSPITADAPAERFLTRRGHDAGYMLLIQTDELASDRARIDALASDRVRVVWSAELDDISAMHLHPHDTGGAILSLDQPVPARSWRWGGPEWERAVHTEVVSAITGVELTAADPERLAARWGELLGRSIVENADGAPAIQLDGSRLTFVALAPGAHEGLTTIELRANNAAHAARAGRQLGLAVHESAGAVSVEIANTRFRLVE